MFIGLGLSLTNVAAMGGGSFSPANLGASLLGWWDAEDASRLTLSGAQVTTWTDKVANYAPTQAIGGSKPVYSATSFNGRPGLTFDGVDDELTLGSVPFPTGANAVEIWALIDRTALAADTAVRCITGYGDTSTATQRRLYTSGVSGVSRLLATIGGTGTTAIPMPAVDIQGRSVARVTSSPTSSVLEANGTAGSPAALVPAIGTTRFRIGANAINTASQFHQGVINSLLVTAPLTGPQAASLLAYLKSRGGIA